MFIDICSFFSFWSEELLNQKLSSLKAKDGFCDWQINVSILPNVTRLKLSRIGNEFNKNINWLQD